MIEIPCKPGGQSNWTQRTTLGGSEFTLSFSWSQRDGAWRLTVSDLNGDAIVSGRRVNADWPLLGDVIDPRRPLGELMAVDTTGARDVDPGFADLGDRFALMFLEPGDLP